VRRDAEHRPVSAKTLATTLPQEAWREVSWREGSNQTLTSRFAAVRIRPASRDWKLAAPHPLEWLLIEWPEGEREPTKYWLSTLPEDTPIEFSSTPRNCAGASSATMRNSRANSASPISKGEAGEASITTPRSASPPMDS
jgi:hypothetical protein